VAFIVFNYFYFCRSCGLPDNLHTFGLVSGLFTSGFSLGAFLGPTLAGYLVNQYEFAWSSSVCRFLNIFTVSVFCSSVFIVFRNSKQYI